MRSIDVVPAPALPVAADGRHHLGDLAGEGFVFRLRFFAVHPHQVPGDLEVVADDAAVLLPHMRIVVAPVLEELLLDEGAVVVVREVLGDGVECVLQHPAVALLARGEIEVDQVGRRVVADRVPVLLGPVRAQRFAARVQRDRVEMGEISPQLLVQEEAVEQVDRHFRVLENPRIAGDAVGLDRTRQGVDLFVGRDGVEVVAELRREDLGLPVAGHVDGVIPVDDVFVEVVEAQVLAQIFGALFRRLQVAIVAGQHVGGGETVDQARDGVGFLAVIVLFLLPGDLDGGAVVVIVDFLAAELGEQVELAERPDLPHPPVRLLEVVFVRLAPEEHQVLRLEIEAAAFVVEGAVDEQETPRREHAAHLIATPLARLVQVVRNPGVCLLTELDGELPVIRCPDVEAVGVFVEIHHIAGDGVGE